MSIAAETCIVAAIDALRCDDSSAVTILCSNPEGSGPDNEAVEVVASWTNWETRRFNGATVAEALNNALAAAPPSVVIPYLEKCRHTLRMRSSQEEGDVFKAVKWAIKQLRGNSELGDSYWENFPEYRLLAFLAAGGAL